MNTRRIAFVLGSSLFILAAVISGHTQDRKIEPVLKPVYQVMPSYPDHLKEEGVEGEVVIVASINAKGSVVVAWIAKPLHPELDRLALEAFKQWRYEPYLYHGEPMPVPTFASIVFSLGSRSPLRIQDEPEEETGSPAGEEPLADELRNILDRCAEYCQRLSDSALFYVCQEKISQSVKTVTERALVFNATFLEDNAVFSAGYRYPALQGGKKTDSVNDYQLVRKEGKIAERRTPLRQEEGSPKEDALKRADTPRSLQPMFVPAMLLGRGQRSSYSFTLKDEERVSGRNAFVIEVKPRRKSARGIREARIWTDKLNFRVLKAEIKSFMFDRNDLILAECEKYHLTPLVITRHFYGVESKGLLYPSRSEIRVEYQGLLEAANSLKSKTGITYTNYKFFTVESEPAIKGIKRIPLLVLPSRFSSIISPAAF